MTQILDVTTYYLPHPNKDCLIEQTRAVGVSGTEVAAFVVMEQLAIRNPESLFFISTKTKTHSTNLSKQNKINIKNLLFLKDLEIPEETSTLIVSVQFPFPKHILNKLRKLTHIIYVGHFKRRIEFNQEYEYIRNIREIKITFVHLCKWSGNYIYNTTHLNQNNHAIIGNPLISDMMANNLTKEPNSFVFSACFERGGPFAIRVFDLLNLANKKMCIASYYPIDTTSVTNDITIVNSLGKSELFSLLAKTEFFIYPIVLECGLIHKDTFACCVAEALAHGVKVITFRQGALEELYSKYKSLIYFVNADPIDQDAIINVDYCADGRRSENPDNSL